jgi:putative ABC transport system permease protein
LSFVLESTLLGLAGGIVGGLSALPTNGLASATQGGSFTDLSFHFQITGQALLAGIAFGGVVGLLGGLLPAFRASRLPIVTALRDAA